jgi:hypothetical protein
MRVSVVPDRPIIFLHLPFAFQVSVTDCATSVRWICVEFVGWIRSLKESTASTLRGIVIDALGVPQQSERFAHILSGSRSIATDFEGSKQFSLFFCANDIPPSYDGAGMSISYELRFSALPSRGAPHSVTIPLRIVGDCDSVFPLEKIQSRAQLLIKSCECACIRSPFAIRSPGESCVSERTAVELVGAGSLSIDRCCRAGASLSAVFNFCKAVELFEWAKIKIVRNELYIGTGINERTVVAKERFSVNRSVMLRAMVEIPWNAAADFATNAFTVSHEVRVRLIRGKKKGAEFIGALRILPPECVPSVCRAPLSVEAVDLSVS